MAFLQGFIIMSVTVCRNSTVSYLGIAYINISLLLLLLFIYIFLYYYYIYQYIIYYYIFICVFFIIALLFFFNLPVVSKICQDSERIALKSRRSVWRVRPH